MLVYATTADLAGWVSSSVTIPDDAPQLLRSASIIVAREIKESLHDAATVTTDARRDATCAQVVSWLSSGIRPGSGGLHATPVVKAKAVDTARIEYDSSLSASTAALAKRAELADDLCPEAQAILRSAGLLWVPVPLFTSPGPAAVAPGAEAPVRYVHAEWWQC